jgi:hypothetical protein
MERGAGGEVVADSKTEKRGGTGCTEGVFSFFLCFFSVFSKQRREQERRVEEGAPANRAFISFLGLLPLTFFDLLFFSFVPFLCPSFLSLVIPRFPSWR